MKRGFITKATIFMAVIVCCTSFIVNKKEVGAATLSDIPLQKVEDINNSPFPTTSLIYFTPTDYRNYSKFKIDSPGQIQAVFRCGATTKGTGSTWISRDELGNDIVGTISTFTGTQTAISWFLESGSYYIHNIWKDSISQVNIALLYEDSITEETVAVSGFINNNLIDLETTVNCFLSTTIPNDYYKFVLPKRANVSFEYSFDAASNVGDAFGYCTLFDDDTLFLKDGSYSKADRGTQKFVYSLEAGTYYIKLHGLYGNTTLNIKPMYYNITLTPEDVDNWTDEPMDIDIDTSIDYSEIMVLNKDVEEAVINNNDVWARTSENYIKLDGETFTVEKSGVYSVRITDKYGNYTMQKIKVSNIDVTKPKVTGVTNKKAYNKAVTIKWTDSQCGINNAKTTLNGKLVSSGMKVTEQGKYTLKVYDNIGNLRTVVFYVDYTAPTAGVENGKTYTDTVTLKFKDAISGIKKITVDDVEESITNTIMSCYFDGTYTLKMWDNAGNYTKIVFKIKKSY